MIIIVDIRSSNMLDSLLGPLQGRVSRNCPKAKSQVTLSWVGLGPNGRMGHTHYGLTEPSPPCMHEILL